jgi:hypothetical protein
MLQPLSNAHNNWAASNHEIFISCPRSLGYSAPRSQRPPPLSSVRKPHRKLTVQMNRRFDSSSGGKACRGKDAGLRDLHIQMREHSLHRFGVHVRLELVTIFERDSLLCRRPRADLIHQPFQV